MRLLCLLSTLKRQGPNKAGYFLGKHVALGEHLQIPMKRWSGLFNEFSGRPGVRRGAKVRSGLGECGGDVGGCNLSEGLLSLRMVCRFVWFVEVRGSFVETQDSGRVVVMA